MNKANENISIHKQIILIVYFHRIHTVFNNFKIKNNKKHNLIAKSRIQ
jgi:hypothetical protein